MSSDAYSPLTGVWGVEGTWDVFYGGLAAGALGLLLLLVGTTRASRLAGAAGLLAVPAGCFAASWLGGVTIPRRGDPHTYCLMRGPVDGGTDCGAAYLTRYWSAASPIAIALIVLAVVLAIQVRVRLTRPAQALAT